MPVLRNVVEAVNSRCRCATRVEELCAEIAADKSLIGKYTHIEISAYHMKNPGAQLIELLNPARSSIVQLGVRGAL